MSGVSLRQGFKAVIDAVKRIRTMTLMMDWEKLLSRKRKGRKAELSDSTRSEFERDHDRILFSPAFRRLHDKTQVFPMPEHDHVHSRLTHTIETASVGYTLGRSCAEAIIKTFKLTDVSSTDFGDIVSAACMAHDIGNPPFGHSGEKAIASWFKDHRKEKFLSGLAANERLDLENFEGNANGFRVVTKLQIHPDDGGMQLNYATLGALVKYPQGSFDIEAADKSEDRSGKRRAKIFKKFNCFRSEESFFKELMIECGIPRHRQRSDAWMRHPLAFLMEAADDICYRVLDMEDGFVLKHIPYKTAEDGLVSIIREDRKYFLLTKGAEAENVGHLRARAITSLVNQVRTFFIEHLEKFTDGKIEAPIIEQIPSADAVENLREQNEIHCYKQPSVLTIELAGYKVIGELLTEFVPAVVAGKTERSAKQRKLVDLLLPVDIDGCKSDYEKILRVTDYISGMSDTYAMSTYRRLIGVAIPR